MSIPHGDPAVNAARYLPNERHVTSRMVKELEWIEMAQLAVLESSIRFR
jgi:hypothetical protein